MTEYFVKTANGKWEEVDEFVFTNHRFVESKDGVRRYSDQRFCFTDGMVDLSNVGNLDKPELGIISRLCGVAAPTGSVPGGYVSTPKELLPIKRGRGYVYYDLQTKKKFKMVG